MLFDSYTEYPSLTAGGAATSPTSPSNGAITGEVLPDGPTGGHFAGTAPALPASERNWLMDLFGPDYIDYPLWVADPPPPAPPAPVPTPPPATPDPAPRADVPPARLPLAPDAIARHYTYNPAFTAVADAGVTSNKKREQGDTLTCDAAPLTFVVPDGCSSVEIWYGPVEVVPKVGNNTDLHHPFRLDSARVRSQANEDLDDGELVAGQTIQVIPVWRTSTQTTIEAQRVRAKVFARFF